MIDLTIPKKSLCAAGVAVALLVGAGIALPAPALTQVKASRADAREVLVTNPASQPVPVAIQGTPTVTLDPTAPVASYDAWDAAEPFQAYLSGYGSSVTVPAGKRLVIEHVGLYGQIKGGVLFGPAVRTFVAGKLQAHQLSFDSSTYFPEPGSGNTRYEGSKSLRLYADPGTRVDFVYSTEAGFNTHYGAASLSGYLVAAP